MKVNDYLGRLKGPYAGEAKGLEQDKSQKVQSGQEESSASAGDKVQLSEQAKEKAYARDIVNSTPEIRAEKVADIKARVEAGTYDVNATAVADKFIKSVISEVV